MYAPALAPESAAASRLGPSCDDAGRAVALIGVDASRLTRPRPTGTERYSRHVVDQLLRQDRHNRYRLYFNQPPPADAAYWRQAEVRCLALPRLWTHLALSREMLRDPPDVLFVPSHVLPALHPRRSVVVVYDVGHRFFPRAHRLTEWLYVEWAIRRHVRVATRVITISRAAKADIVRLYARYGARAERIVVAHPAVDASFRPAAPAETARVRARLGLPPRYVLYLGTVKPRKNLPRLVRAFARADLPRDVTLVLAGDTTFGAGGVARAVRETRLEERVRRLPYVAAQDLAGLYTGAACVALPSLHEGFGLPALEALACGAPLVTSNRSALPETVGAAAELVDPLDISAIAAGLERVLGDPARAAALRAAGPEQAHRFRWQDAGRVTLAALNESAGA